MIEFQYSLKPKTNIFNAENEVAYRILRLKQFNFFTKQEIEFIEKIGFKMILVEYSPKKFTIKNGVITR